jgi:hypothetical protein
VGKNQALVRGEGKHSVSIHMPTVRVIRYHEFRTSLSVINELVVLS